MASVGRFRADASRRRVGPLLVKPASTFVWRSMSCALVHALASKLHPHQAEAEQEGAVSIDPIHYSNAYSNAGVQRRTRADRNSLIFVR